MNYVKYNRIKEQEPQFSNDFANTAEPDFLESKMNQYWGRRSSSYSEQNSAQLLGDRRSAWESFIFNEIDESKPLKVLDIGTGPGFLAILAALRNHDVVAVDMNADMLDKAGYNAKSAGVSIDFVQVGHMLPFEDKSFDLIISRDVTWTLTEPEKQLRHWSDKLKNGGSMLYFDAEWYYYLRSKESRAVWEENRKQVIASGGFEYSEAYKLEKLALSLPMTYRHRPSWDEKYWSGQNNFSFNVRQNINTYVYNSKEQMQYELFPEFLVSVWRLH